MEGLEGRRALEDEVGHRVWEKWDRQAVAFGLEAFGLAGMSQAEEAVGAHTLR